MNSNSATTTIDGPDGVSNCAEASNPPATARTPAAAPTAMFSGREAKRRTVAAGITSSATISRTPTILMATAMTAAIRSPNSRRARSGRSPATVARSTLTVAASNGRQIHHSTAGATAPPPQTINAALIAVAPRRGSVFTREALGAIEDLTDAAWRAPFSTRVDSLTNYSHSEAIEDDLVVEPLVDDAQSLGNAGLARVEEIALNAIDVAGRLVSRDARVAGLVISFALPENPDAAVVEITDYLDTLLDEARASHPDTAYYLTGDVVMNRAFAEATQDDLETMAPIVFLMIVVAAAVVLRSVLGTLALVVVLVFVINTTVGFAGWIGTVFNPANSGVPIIVMTVAVAHSVHIVTAALAGMSRGLDRNEAIAESLRDNAWPVFLTSATTAIGFLSLNASDSPPFRVLGNLVAFGVLCAFVYSIRNIDSMLRGTIIAMALISLILIGVFKSVRLGLVSLVPNFLPAAMAFGL